MLIFYCLFLFLVPPPTKPHKPGYFAPEKPPNKDDRTILHSTSNLDVTYDDNYLQYLPKIHRDLHEQISETQNDEFAFSDFEENEFDAIGNFLKNYEDYEELDADQERDASPFLRKKRIPPTKAYVEMLMLYDLMKRDAKTQNLQNYAVSRNI